MKTPTQINAMKKELRELLMHGYEHGGSFEHGDKVHRLKAEILVAIEELKLFAK